MATDRARRRRPWLFSDADNDAGLVKTTRDRVRERRREREREGGFEPGRTKEERFTCFMTFRGRVREFVWKVKPIEPSKSSVTLGFLSDLRVTQHQLRFSARLQSVRPASPVLGEPVHPLCIQLSLLAEDSWSMSKYPAKMWRWLVQTKRKNVRRYWCRVVAQSDEK